MTHPKTDPAADRAAARAAARAADRSEEAFSATIAGKSEDLGKDPTLMSVHVQPEVIDRRLGATFIDKYRIESLIGKGGFGSVYRAVHTGLGSSVAVKFLLASWARDPVFRARFEREARVLGKLRHPAIVAVHDFGQEAGADGDLYLVMEHVAGRPLSDEILSTGMATPRALALADQILDALSEAHAGGVVHRVLKARGCGDPSRSAARASVRISSACARTSSPRTSDRIGLPI